MRVGQMEELRGRLMDIDGRGYKAYQSIKGIYAMPGFTLFIDHVQADPFAPPSRIRVRVEQRVARLPRWAYANKVRAIACADFLARTFRQNIHRYVQGRRGTGNSGMMWIDAGGQEVLERTAVWVTEEFVEARISVGLPGHGRVVVAKQAMDMLIGELPRVVQRSLVYQNIDRTALSQHVQVVEDQEFVRGQLSELGLVAFIGDGSILPRESGATDLPMPEQQAVKFESPPSLRVQIRVPSGEVWTGMGIPVGVTLIVGGGYHGKSTLLNALQRCVYPHIPGDGRERVVTVPTAVKIRAEDGRRVEQVDISCFIANLPMGKSTIDFSSDDASGSTSQAANIVEALEAGATLLLLDEDTCASNFMVRDARMQALVTKDKEPITPFVDRVRELYERYGVSTILVMGGCGDYFDVADTVIMMDRFIPLDVTERAREVAQSLPAGRQLEATEPITELPERVPIPESFPQPRYGRPDKIGVKSIDQVIWNKQMIDLRAVEQIVDISQSRAIAEALVYALHRYVDGQRSVREILDAVERDIDAHRLDVLSPFQGHPGDLARPRRFEIAAALNRLRCVRMMQRKK